MDFKKESDQLTVKDLSKILKDNNNSEESLAEILPKIEKVIETSKRRKSKAQDLEKLSLPSITNQNRIAKAIYDARKEGDLIGLKLNKFSTIQDHLDGLQDGFYLIGADTNIGKSAVSHNICLDAIQTNPEIIGLYFSLDDSYEDILTRMRANIAGIEINSVKMPWRLDNEEKHKLNDAYNQLDRLEDRLCVLDVELVPTFEKLIHFIETAKERNKGKKIVIFIDAIMNLDVKEDPSKPIRELNIIRANKLKEISKEYAIPLICTVELKKRDKPEKPPQINEIMESGKYGFNANVILLLHSTEEEMEKEETIITVYWRKNKLGGFKGSTNLLFNRKYGQIKETTKEAQTNNAKENYEQYRS